MEEKKGMKAVERSAFLTALGILLLFSAAICVTLIAPTFVDKSWTQPSSEYQRQMYEFVDPYVYISNSSTGGDDIQYVYHLKNAYSVLSFSESETVKIVAPRHLQAYINKPGKNHLVLTSKLLLLREPKNTEDFQAAKLAQDLQNKLQNRWKDQFPNWEKEQKSMPHYEILELYAPEQAEVFSLAETDGILENWIDENYEILDKNPQVSYHHAEGVVYVKNPKEYRISPFKLGRREGWQVDPLGKPVLTVAELKSDKLGFLSRKELIQEGERIYAIEGCHYCHTDQTRTLVQDTVLNGSEDFPAPPSSASEYIYQKTTFPGTQRNGPDLSRVAIKRPGRDWHKAHFWSPKTESKGSIMPSFRHFFDFDPRGTSKNPYGVPNYKFEAVYQYLMTKGSRITAPNRSWWTGRDPVKTKEIIEGRKKG